MYCCLFEQYPVWRVVLHRETVMSFRQDVSFCFKNGQIGYNNFVEN